VGPRAVLGAVVKRKIPSPHQESKLDDDDDDDDDDGDDDDDDNNNNNGP
jgi:hypothetical protein